MTDPARLSELIQRHVDGVLTDTEAAELNAALLTSPEAAAQLAAAMRLDATITRTLRSEKTTTNESNTRAPLSAAGVPMYRKGYEPQPFKLRAHHYALIAATLLAACGLATYLLTTSVDPKPVPVDPNQPGPSVATLIESTGQLSTPGGSINEGDDYGRGEYTLSSGTAEFMLTNAVNVKLRGETRMTMRNNMNVALTRGSAEFVCPTDAKGFTVHLPDNSRVVDLGTAFRVAIDDDRRAKLVVTDGKVKWIPAVEGAEAQLVSAGQGIHINDGRFAPMTYAETILAQNPLAYWRFEDTTGAATRGKPASFTSGVTTDAIAPAPATGFGGFESSNAAVAITEPGFINLPMGKAMNAAEGAVSFWIARGPGGGDKLYYGSDDTRGDGGGGANELHLDMSPHGAISVFIRGRSSADVHFATNKTYSDNAWHHVTATWNAKRTTLHIDGGALAGGETVTGPGSPANFAFSAVHRFGAPGRLEANRNFEGRVDELAVWTTVLTAEQVAAQYQAAASSPGTPTNHQPTPESETADR